MQYFPERLKDALTTSGMTQVEFADKICMSPQVVNNYLKGRKHPSLYVFNEICKALNQSSDYLLGLTDVPK